MHHHCRIFSTIKFYYYLTLLILQVEKSKERQNEQKLSDLSKFDISNFFENWQQPQQTQQPQQPSCLQMAPYCK